MNKVLREDRREWINETENEINPSFKLLRLQLDQLNWMQLDQLNWMLIACRE